MKIWWPVTRSIFAEDYDLRAPVANLLKSLEDVLWYSVDYDLDYLGFSSR